MMRRNGASFALFSVGEMGYWTLLFRFSAVLRNAVVMCRPLITPDNCWHKTTWPEFQPSLPPGRPGPHAGMSPCLGGAPRVLVCDRAACSPALRGVFPHAIAPPTL